MLIRFMVENFLSFKDKTEFSMIAGSTVKHDNHMISCNGNKVLKGAFVFGPNAGGKTNFIRAISFAKSIIINGIENTNLEKKYFRLDNEWKEKPGIFQFDIFSGEHFYSYGFALSYTSASIEEEWLYQIDKKDVCIFLRSKKENEDSFEVFSDIEFINKAQKERFDIYKDDISNSKMKQTLFLADIFRRIPDTEKEYQPFRDVMSWFGRLMVVFPESKYQGITQLLDDENEKARLETLLNYFDTGICSVSKKEVEFTKAFARLPEELIDSLKANLIKDLSQKNQRAFVQNDSSLMEIKNNNGELLAYEVVSNHGNDNELFDYRDESDGTQRLFDLIPLYQNLLKNAVVFIDELDRSLHTKAAREFIHYFYDLTSENFSQLIATTHNSNIMDLELLREDEIWFVKRKDNHSSELYSLNRYQEKFDIMDNTVEMEYLLGRYDAIPVFRKSVLNSKDEGVQGGKRN